jgi:hypothetical protein
VNDLEDFRKPFEVALRLLLIRWQLWAGDDQMRAMSVGFDSSNTEICVSLLTDREPTLERLGMDGLAEPWPVASWRLFGISRSGQHCFPDASALVSWMHAKSGALEGSTDQIAVASAQLNESLKRFFFEVATSEAILEQLSRFRQTTTFPIRVQWFFEQDQPLEHIAREVGREA